MTTTGELDDAVRCVVEWAEIVKVLDGGMQVSASARSAALWKLFEEIEYLKDEYECVLKSETKSRPEQGGVVLKLAVANDGPDNAA